MRSTQDLGGWPKEPIRLTYYRGSKRIDSDYKAMKPYIDVCDEIKAEAMKKFDDF
jgi:hypothetical protein